MRAKSLQSCLTLCDPVDCTLPGSSVHGIFQARTVEWVALLQGIFPAQSPRCLRGMATAYLKHPDSLLWQEEIRAAYTHTHTHAHTHARTRAHPMHKHRSTHIPQEPLWTPARAGNGGSRKEITVATSRVLCADRPWWLH